MVDYSVDMVEQMKGCLLLQHVRHLDPTCISVERTIEMATINGAKALGLEREIGSLEPGKRADIAIFDLKRPYVGVLHRPISTFVCAGKGSDARAVLVTARSSTGTGSSSGKTMALETTPSRRGSASARQFSIRPD